ncbi:MAG: hypothetical protein O3C27_15645 [Actinomycetota bacterium]|nr:hypothetical protein [Actinomycetota bacterium]
MTRSFAAYGMLLDRGLTLEQLDLAYDVAVADPNPKTNRRRLTIALRDMVSEQEAEGKTKKCLTRVWLNPPPDAAAMIAWARAQSVQRQNRQIFHFAAVLATFPFVGSVCRVIGQHLQTEQAVEAQVVRAGVRRLLGDRPSVDVAARKTYTTLKNLGLLEQNKQVVLRPREPLSCDHELAGMLAHALMLTRGAGSLPESSLPEAPELLGVGHSLLSAAGESCNHEHEGP